MELSSNGCFPGSWLFFATTQLNEKTQVNIGNHFPPVFRGEQNKIFLKHHLVMMLGKRSFPLKNGLFFGGHSLIFHDLLFLPLGHGSVENCCISKMSFLQIRGSFSTSVTNGERGLKILWCQTKNAKKSESFRIKVLTSDYNGCIMMRIFPKRGSFQILEISGGVDVNFG